MTTSPTPPRAYLPSLPPELLSAIFLRRSSSTSTTRAVPIYSTSAAYEADQPLRLSPSSIAISRSLLPFTRANAYDHVTICGDVALARFGETLKAEGGKNAWCGGLVRVLEVKGESKRFSHGRQQEEGNWSAERLAAGHLAVFDHLVPGVLQEVIIDRASPEQLLTLPVLSSHAFSAPRIARQRKLKLIIVGNEPVSFECLRFLSKATGVGEVEVRGAMRLKTEGGAAMFPESERVEGLEKVAIESEPHAAGLVPFLEQTSIRSLRLRCSTTDPNVVFGALGPRTKANLEEINFSPSGYLQREIGLAFASFPSLTYLTLRSSSLLLTDMFFFSLRSLPKLCTLSLRGPVATGGQPCDTVALVADWLESLTVDGRLERLEAVRLDVPPGGKAAVRTVAGEGRPVSRAEYHARRLVAAALRVDVRVSGSFLDYVSATSY
ncbi:hypothetical protein JCM11251_003884 [Rhodosporidiobolus azoricus]